MPLWQTSDANTSAPKFMVLNGLGANANGFMLFDQVGVGAEGVPGVGIGVFGVSAAETSNTSGEGPKVAHAGWVLRKQGTGYVQSIAVSAANGGGTGYTPGSNGYITFSGGGAGVGANAFFQVNALGNIANVTVLNSGNTYNVAPTANAAVAYTTPATFVVTMGGRTGRVTYETLVASGNIGADTGNDDVIFPGA